ncbi:MAG: polyphosphate kinase 1 [Rectinema sp.]
MHGRVFNRELSWLEFNARVLAEGLKPSTPLLERLKFLAIVATNFDEFFMVRVASVKSRIRDGDSASDDSGLSPRELLARINARTREILARQYGCLTGEILPALAAAGVELVSESGWTQAERRHLEDFFTQNVFPLVTPLRVDEGAFPSTGNLRLHVAFPLHRGEEESLLAIAQVPPNVPRFVRIAGEHASGLLRFALLEDIVAAFGARFFPGYGVGESLVFKVTRDADFGVDEDREADFLIAMEEVLAGRQNSAPVRLSYHGRDSGLADRLRIGLGLDPEDVFALPGPVDLRGFMDFVNAEGMPRSPEGSFGLRDKPWPPVSVSRQEGLSIWDEIDSGDKLLMVPYESFEPVLRFLDEAADDPSVLAIKMTLYRTSGDSPIVKALARAARNGKQVAVVVELKARFDEERNIEWAGRLEQAGAIVTYGVARLKVHAKAAIVVRRTKEGQIRRYVHLSTGNYNDRTAKSYSDLSIFTANDELCRETSILFNTLTGYSAVQTLGRLAVAPFDLKTRLLGLIEREAQRSSPELPGLIMAKLNALADPDIIEALYAASRAGVSVKLNVRGICTLIPGVPGMSEHIEVHSLVGRYLEHSRIFYFRNGGAEEIFLSSADWLPRNLDRRIELMFPVLDERLRARTKSIVEDCFADTAQSHRLMPDGSWEPLASARGEKPFSAQEHFYSSAKRAAEIVEAPQEELQVRRRFS